VKEVRKARQMLFSYLFSKLHRNKLYIVLQYINTLYCIKHKLNFYLGHLFLNNTLPLNQICFLLLTLLTVRSKWKRYKKLYFSKWVYIPNYYPVKIYMVICTCKGYYFYKCNNILCLSLLNIEALIVPPIESYSRSTPCALNWIYTF
jgi:hypothetical protein